MRFIYEQIKKELIIKNIKKKKKKKNLIFKIKFDMMPLLSIHFGDDLIIIIIVCVCVC